MYPSADSITPLAREWISPDFRVIKNTTLEAVFPNTVAASFWRAGAADLAGGLFGCACAVRGDGAASSVHIRTIRPNMRPLASQARLFPSPCDTYMIKLEGLHVNMNAGCPA